MAEHDVRYLDELAGLGSIITMSVHQLRALGDHAFWDRGRAEPEPELEAEQASLTLDRFARAGVHYQDVTNALERWSLSQLAASFHETVSLIGAARDSAAR